MTSLPTILFPCDYFNKSQVENDYKNEYEIAKSLGFDCALFDYDALTKDGIFKTNIRPNSLVIYRGWMLSTFAYNTLILELEQTYKCYVLVDYDDYKFCHYFDHSYTVLAQYTPNILVVTDFNFSKIKQTFNGFFMMKDNVKSVKGTNFPSKIPVDISQNDFNELVKRFIELRGDLYTGQIILKQYVDLKKYGDTTNEIRGFYFKHHLISLSNNSNQSTHLTWPPVKLIDIPLKVIVSDFFTVDFAELENGEWIIIETGDGQVSGLTPNQNILEFYSKIMLISQGKL